MENKIKNKNKKIEREPKPERKFILAHSGQ